MMNCILTVPMVDLECPVSKERFVDPRVLPCGHTIDYASLKDLPSRHLGALHCPLCQKAFGQGRKLPPNWTLMSVMGLDVPLREKEKIASMTTMESVRMTSEAIIDAAVEKELIVLRKKIRKEAAKGNGSYSYRVYGQFSAYPEGMHNLLDDRIRARLRQEGFTVRTGYAGLTLCWSCDDSRITEISWLS